ncbi:AI-2E family transporter [Deinococcus multiflagellatus]|uniref:AI-2E family transporter n=1 Tax=Deinococcus multiflagellatus TaxID=1656887 RepID=A0ABW1ZGX6_9DEIO
MPRPVGIALLVATLLAVLSGVLPLMGTVLKEVQLLGRQLPTLTGNLETIAHGLVQRFPVLRGAQAQLDSWIQTLPNQLSAELGALLSPKGALVSGVVGAAGWIGRAFVTLIISVYMMAIYPSMGPFLLRLLPVRFQPLAQDISEHVSRAVGGYFRGQLTVAVIMGVIIGVGLSLLGLPSALAIGFLAALLNIVPYLGVILSVIPALLLALPFGLLKVAAVAALFVGANQLEGHVIAPRVVSQNTHLSSLAVLLSILFGVELFGLMGAVVAVPTVAALKSLLDAYYYRSPSYRAQPAAGRREEGPPGPADPGAPPPGPGGVAQG